MARKSSRKNFFNRPFSRPQRRSSARIGTGLQSAQIASPSENLEARKLLTTFDGDDQAIEAHDYGTLSSNAVSIHDSLSFPTDVDAYRFEAREGQELSAVVFSSSGLAPRLRLFGPPAFGSAALPQPIGVTTYDGQIMKFQIPKTGTYYLGVSEVDNEFYDINSGRFDTAHPAATTGSYILTFGDTSQPDLVDLVGTQFKAANAASAAGNSVNVSFQIRNDGPGDSGAFDVAIYGSTNSYISPLDTLLTTVRVSGIAGGATYQSGQLNVALPEGFEIPEAGMFVGMVIDSDNDITESSETNNSNEGAGLDYAAVAKISKADLVAAHFDVDRNELSPGQTTRIDYRIRNTGNVASGTFRVSFYASIDSIISKDDMLLESVDVPSVPASDSTGLRPVWVTLSNEFQALDDAFSIGMIIDSLDDVAESNEANNRNVGVGIDREAVTFVAQVPAQVELTLPKTLPFTDAEFTWTAAASASVYELWVTNLTTRERVIHRTDLNEASFSYGGTLAAGTYRVWVRAGNGAGWSAWSTGVDIKVGSTPSQPVLTLPRTLAADNPGFTWEAVGDADRYELWVTNMDTRARVIHRTDLTDASFTFSGVLAAGSYRVWVRAANAAGWGEWSTGGNVKVTTDGVVIPEQVKLTLSSTLPATNPEFRWNALASADQYELWVTHVDSRQRVIHKTDLTDGSFTYDGTLAAGKYRVWVRAGNAAGWGAWSAGADVVVGVQLNRPEITMPQSVAQNNVPFTWTAIDGAAHYELWVTDLDTQERVIHHTDLTGSSFTAASMTAGNYRVWVRAGNDTGWGAWSAGHTLTVAVDSGQAVPVFTPEPLTGSTLLTANVSWKTAVGVTRCEFLLQGTENNAGTHLQAAVDTDSLSAVGSLTIDMRQHGLSAGLYLLRLRSVSDDGVSEWSSPLEFYYAGTFTIPNYTGWILGVNTGQS